MPLTLQKKRFDFTVLGFAIPFCSMLILMIAAGFVPFGEYSFLSTDCYHQYYPFFLSFRRALLGGDSILYNWSVGMGVDHLGLIAYYLASPFNLLSILIPENALMAYFNLLIPVRMGLAGWFFSIFLNRIFHKNDFSICIFGSFYALCAWSLGYFWNIMWLETFALLPLVALGTVYLLRDKKFILYTVALFFSIACNYYIGFFTCIFTLLCFICYEICCWKGIRRFALDFLRIALFSLLAIGMTAFLELPAYMALQNTHSSALREAYSMNIANKELYKEVDGAWNAAKLAWADKNFSDLFTNGWVILKGTLAGLLDGMRQAAGNMNGGSNLNFKEGLPNLYAGNVTIVLALLFLTLKQIKLRDKLCCVFLLLFMLTSFVFRELDYIWHGFHFPKMIPYRFSFLYSFVMLYMAYRAYLYRNEFKIWQILTALFLSIGLIFCSNDLYAFIDAVKNGTFAASISNIFVPGRSFTEQTELLQTLITQYRFILYTGGMLVLNLVWLIIQWVTNRIVAVNQQELISIPVRRVCTCIVLTVMCLELLFNVLSFSSQYSGVNIRAYPRGTEDSKKIISYMHQLEENTLFYRAETSHTQTYNDGPLNNYNGITAFTSSANVNVTEFMKELGYGAKNSYNRYAYEEGSPVAALFVNLKYMIDRDGTQFPNDYFDVVASSGKVTLLKNNAYLPLGFLVNDALTEFTFEGDDQFDKENKLLQAASGLPVNVWHILDEEDLSVICTPKDSGLQNQITAKPSKSTPNRYNYTANADGTITYRYTLDRAGLVCFNITDCSPDSFSLWHLDGMGKETKLYSEKFSLDQTLSACSVNPGDMIEVRFECKKNESGLITMAAAVLDDNLFRAAYDSLNASTLKLTEFSNTQMTGTINCNRDGILYTSIAQNSDCWSVTVDGKPSQIVLIHNAMIGIPLKEGVHTVRLQYHNRYFTIGWIVSLVCLIAFVTLWIFLYKPTPKKAVKKLQKIITKLPITVSKKGKYLKE